MSWKKQHYMMLLKTFTHHTESDMDRRNFIRASVGIGLGSFLPFPSWAKDYLPNEFELVQPSLSSQFVLLKIQRLLMNSGMLRPELERLMVTNLDGPEEGNAFACGRFFPKASLELDHLLGRSYSDYKKSPGNEMNRRLMAYALGALAFSKTLLSFSGLNATEYLNDPQKTADLDYLVLRNFYLKSESSELTDPKLLVDLLNTMTTRTYVRYHTLKCAEDMPLKWLDHTIAYRERQLKHYEEVSMRFSSPPLMVPKTVFDPLDPALHLVSPGLNVQKVSGEVLGDLIAVPTMHSALGKSILGGVKLVLDYSFKD
jgi:hypothetical protein